MGLLSKNLIVNLSGLFNDIWIPPDLVIYESGRLI